MESATLSEAYGGVPIRELRLRPSIAIHDLETKLRTLERMRKKGEPVRVSVLLRGREISHVHRVVELLKSVGLPGPFKLTKDQRRLYTDVT